MVTIGTCIYRMMERLDGERGMRLISYKLAERIKLFVLVYLIEGVHDGR